MSRPGFTVPPGQYPPFAVVTDKDHAAWIILATAIGLACVLLFGGIRLLTRSTISHKYGLDDAFVAASTLLTVIQSCIVLGACADGLGKSLELVPSGMLNKIEREYYASTLLFVIALGLSKTSVVFFLRRLSPVPHHRRFLDAMVVFISVWTVASTFAVALQCNLAHPWIVIGEHCSGALLRWQVICAFDILFEISLVGLAVYLVWELQTSLATKAIVVCAFSFRLPMIIPIAFRLATFDNAGRSTNLTLLEDVFIVWTQTELNYSLISATIPTLRLFVSNLNTQLGGVGQSENYGYGSASRTHVRSQKSYQMSALKPAEGSNTEEESTATGSMRIYDGLRANTYSYGVRKTSAGGEINSGNHNQKRNGDATSVDSDDSQRMIIRKDVTYEVETEGA